MPKENFHCDIRGFDDDSEAGLLRQFQTGRITAVDYVCRLSCEVRRDYLDWLRTRGLPMDEDTAWRYMDILEAEFNAAAGTGW